MLNIHGLSLIGILSRRARFRIWDRSEILRPDLVTMSLLDALVLLLVELLSTTTRSTAGSMVVVPAISPVCNSG